MQIVLIHNGGRKAETCSNILVHHVAIHIIVLTEPNKN
jgi:hypothetical protein